MHEQDIRSFWEGHPCGEQLVGSLADEYEEFFERYDAFRYRTEGHILDCLDAIDFRDRQVLEIGLGQGADAEQLIRRGARWSGLDLTQESVERVRTRLALRQLPFESVERGSILEAPFADDSFDMVFSHGVLHHVPDIKRAQSEIRRILRPSGELIVMLYARWSLNYLLAISILRRLGLAAMYTAGIRGSGIYADHFENAKKLGLFNYLRMKHFIHRNTDGPHNPYSKVYDLRSVREDFPDFEIVRSYKRHMRAPPLPVLNMTDGKLLGWHLWVHMRPR